ncbi:hypothetical protein BTVI_44208 [Pitangus sulphuratus]|nr:hypothetical protein BTVI_44208 [Pitangus sulphuratus]
MVVLPFRGTSAGWRDWCHSGPGVTAALVSQRPCECSKEKCRVLHLGRNNPVCQYSLGADLMESTVVAMSQQCVLVGRKGHRSPELHQAESYQQVE